MAKLEWDKIGERRWETGVSHGVLYPQTDTGTYDTGVVWNGLINVTESPDGAEPNDLWADNIKYASLRGAETFGASVEAYCYPDEFAECDGSAEPAEGVSVGQQKRKPFGLCYQTKTGNDTATETDDGYKIHIIYNATAGPSERAYETTNDSPDAMTFSWDLDTTPVAVEGTDLKPTSLITIDSVKASPENLKKLCDVLYGTESVEPRLPLPGEIVRIMKGESV